MSSKKKGPPKAPLIKPAAAKTKTNPLQVVLLDDTGKVVTGDWASVCWEIGPKKYVGFIFPDDCLITENQKNTFIEFIDITKKHLLPVLASTYLKKEDI